MGLLGCHLDEPWQSNPAGLQQLVQLGQTASMTTESLLHAFVEFRVLTSSFFVNMTVDLTTNYFTAMSMQRDLSQCKA